MSSAFYPLGMKSYNNYVNQGGYKPWKGPQTPVGLTSGTIRPLTNNDPTNDTNPGFGLPRPIKHHRKGRGFNYTVLVADGNNYKEVEVNRLNRSSTTGNLVSQLIDQPGGFNRTEEQNQNGQIKMVMSYYPNDVYLTENPEPRSQTPAWCCNAEKKARRRVTYASTNLKKNYFTTLQQYRENRCLTYDQRAFNFAEGNPNIGKPGGPESTNSTYYANCQPNNNNIGDPVAFFDSLLANRIITQEQYDRFKTVSLYDQLDEMVKLLPAGNMEENQTDWQKVLNQFDTDNDGKITYDELLQFVITPGYTIEEFNEEFDLVDINKNRLYDFNEYLYFEIMNKYKFFGFKPYPRTNITMNDIYTYLNTLPAQTRANALNALNSDKRCTAVVYKPSNYQFAKQGAVDSSTRLLKLNVDTITKSAFTNNVNLPKNKVAQCTSTVRFQNKRSCLP
jgi:hypothetical protein